MKIHILFLFFLSLSSCRVLEFSRPKFEKKKSAGKSSPTVKNTWTQIESQTQLPFEQRILQIDQFIERYQNEEIALPAYFLKAKLYLEKKKKDKACEVYHQAARSLVIYTSSLKLYQESAKCYLKKDQWSKAFDMLQDFSLSSRAAKLDRKKARLLQWGFIKNKKTAKKQKLIVLSSLFDLSTEVKEKWRQKGIEIIEKLPLEKQLEYEKEKELFPAFSFYLDYKLGNRFFKAKDFDLAQKHFKQALSSPQSKPLKKELENKLALINKSSKTNSSLIGVILPLSGEKKVLGEKILRGLSFGLNRDGEHGFQMIIKDSKNHPDTVRSHIKNLFYKHHVAALIGGLSSETAEIMAEQSEKFSIPAILFSQSQGLSKSRRFVFQNAVSPEQLLTPLIQELRGPLKIDKAAIMHPDDSYGKKYSSFFEKSFSKLGGKVTKKVSYKLEEFDFKDEVKELLHLKRRGREREFEKAKKEFLKQSKASSARSKKLTPENILTPRKNFSALFIPDSSTARIRIRDYLKYFGVDSIYLVGLNLWKPDQLQERDFSILFVNVEEKDKMKSSFYRKFFNSYGQAPGYFEQKAYNSAVFLKQSLNFKMKSRFLLQEKLEKTRRFQGAYNQISLSEDRVFQYPIKVYKKTIKKKSKN